MSKFHPCNLCTFPLHRFQATFFSARFCSTSTRQRHRYLNEEICLIILLQNVSCDIPFMHAISALLCIIEVLTHWLNKPRQVHLNVVIARISSKCKRALKLSCHMQWRPKSTALHLASYIFFIFLNKCISIGTKPNPL